MKRNLIILIAAFVFLFIAAGSLVLFRIYSIVLKPNVDLKGRDYQYICIPTGSDYGKVKEILAAKGYLADTGSFDWLARKKGYEKKVRPGKYKILNGMSNNELVNLLRSGKQEPVQLSFNSVRTNEELAGKVSKQIEADSMSLSRLFNDPVFLSQFQVTPLTVFVLLIPNTYEFYWNTPADQFIRRMDIERGRFWNEKRTAQAKETSLTVPEVITLASIIEKETIMDDEKPVIAGVYMNRLRKNWPLQADPTLIFAWNDFTIKRVLDKHKRIKSPYNTYMHTGLPPGPICLPAISSIEAVLNYKRSDYMYFCAREDFSGYHNFAKTIDEHNKHARRYQAALNKLKVR